MWSRTQSSANFIHCMPTINIVLKTDKDLVAVLHERRGPEVEAFRRIVFISLRRQSANSETLLLTSNPSLYISSSLWSHDRNLLHFKRSACLALCFMLSCPVNSLAAEFPLPHTLSSIYFSAQKVTFASQFYVFHIIIKWTKHGHSALEKRHEKRAHLFI